MHQRTVGATIAVLVTLAAAGCGGDDDPPASDPTTPPPSSSPTPSATEPATPEEKALAQLMAYLDVRDDALRAATIDFKRLSRVATGREFLNIQQNVSAVETSGSKVTGNYVHTIGEPNDRGAYVLITDCEDRSAVKRTKNGRPVPESDPEGKPLRNPLPIDYELVETNGRWLVARSNIRWDESC